MKLYKMTDGREVTRPSNGFSRSEVRQIVTDRHICDVCEAGGILTIITADDDGLCSDCRRQDPTEQLEDKLAASEMYDAEPCQEPQCTDDREPYERYCDAHVTVDCPNCEGCGQARGRVDSCPFCRGVGRVSRELEAEYVPEVTL